VPNTCWYRQNTLMNIRESRRQQSRLDNPETPAALGKMHRTKTNNPRSTAQKAWRNEQYGPHNKTKDKQFICHITYQPCYWESCTIKVLSMIEDRTKSM
jgi:hypothetical protein